VRLCVANLDIHVERLAPYPNRPLPFERIFAMHSACQRRGVGPLPSVPSESLSNAYAPRVGEKVVPNSMVPVIYRNDDLSSMVHYAFY